MEHGTQLWTLKQCLRRAQNYHNCLDWQRHDSESYYAALSREEKQGWLTMCTEHMTTDLSNHKWDLESLVADARQYKNRTEWIANSPGYFTAAKNEWLHLCCAHMERKKSDNIKWTKENCLQSAMAFKTKSDWRKQFNSAYVTAHRNEWLDEIAIKAGFNSPWDQAARRRKAAKSAATRTAIMA